MDELIKNNNFSAKKRGAYFLANDQVLTLVIAFLNSFRKHNPNISLCLIPFDSNINELKKIQTEYNFSIYSDEEILKWCDQTSLYLRGEILGKLRKLAVLLGEFDEFVYFDIDTVVLDNIDFSFNL